ncbi:MAG: sugar phosphate isomerase/epimerase family protein [Eubacteriales bacterium]
MASFVLSAFADEASPALEGQIAALKRNGIRYIEPRNIGGGLIHKTDGELEDIAAALQESGIGVSSFGSPIGKYGIDDCFEVHLADFRRALVACRILGTQRMRVFSFYVPQGRLRECRGEVLRRMEVLLDEADAAGVTLCHENESLIYGQNPGEVRDLLGSLPRLRGVFDAANFVMNGSDPLEGIEATLPSLEYLHVKDAKYPQKLIVPVGKGDGDYSEVLRRVDAATDRTVFLTLEPHLHSFKAYASIDKRALKTGMTFESADAAFDCAADHLKQLLTKLNYHEENGIWKK